MMLKMLTRFRKTTSPELRFSKVKIGDKIFTVCAPKEDIYLDHIGVEFEPVMVKLFKSLISKDFHCLDIGANIGLTTILFAGLAKKIDSFEPSPTTFKILQRNIKFAGLRNVNLFNLGIGSSNMESRLAFDPSNRSGGFVANLTAPGAGQFIETIHIKKLDDLYSEKKKVRLNFLKIDVEGFEKSVLEGGSRIIADQKPIVVLELNHWCLNAFQRITIPDFFDFLRSMFPFLFAVNFDGTYADLHNEHDSFRVMYEHIIHFHFSNLLGAFNEAQLAEFIRNLKK